MQACAQDQRRLFVNGAFRRRSFLALGYRAARPGCQQQARRERLRNVKLLSGTHPLHRNRLAPYAVPHRPDAARHVGTYRPYIGPREQVPKSGLANLRDDEDFHFRALHYPRYLVQVVQPEIISPKS